MPSTVWGQVVMAHIVGVLRHAQHLIDTALLLTEGDAALTDKYRPVLMEDVYKRQGQDIAFPRPPFVHSGQDPRGHIPHIHKIVSALDTGSRCV